MHINWNSFFFGLMIFTPIFLSIGPEGIGFDRLGGHASNYLVTLPISLIFYLVLSLSRFHILFKSKIVLIMLWLITLSVGLKMIFSYRFEYQIFKTGISLLIFFSSYMFFRHFFEMKFSVKNLRSAKALEFDYVILPSLAILVSVLVSWYLVGKYTFLVSGLAIYNFEQYFGFVGVLVLAAMAGRGALPFLGTFVLTAIIGYFSSNITALILIMAVAIGALVGSGVINRFKSVITYSGFLFAISWPLLIVFLIDVDAFRQSNSLISRFSMIGNYFETLNWWNIFLPALSPVRTNFSDMHNELLEIFRSLGIFGIILCYGFFIKSVLAFKPEFGLVLFALILVVFVSGVMVSCLLHPYTQLCVSYFLAFYGTVGQNMKGQKVGAN